jgi:hypothetical protein
MFGSKEERKENYLGQPGLDRRIILILVFQIFMKIDF